MEKISKEKKNKIMKEIGRANNSEYITEYNEIGVPISKKKSKVQKGKKSRARGAQFELKVRENLESKGWIVDKWSNNVDLDENKLVKAKRKYNPFKKILVVGTGFPDFICFKKINMKYEIEGVESKMNGLLSKNEKQKCKWLIDNEIFLDIKIAKKEKEGRKIVVKYDSFKEKYYKKVKS